MSVAEAGTDQGAEHLVVRSGGYRCAIPVAAASLVSRPPELVPLPGSTPRLLGLAQVDGEPVAVVDLHALLDREGDPGGGHQLTVLVRRADGGARLGLAVDEVFGVMPVAGATPPEDDDPPWVSVRGRMDDRPVMVLDVERLFEEKKPG